MTNLESAKMPEHAKLGAGEGSSWVLRWNRIQDRKPRVQTFGESGPKNLDIFESPDGSLAVFSGYLFDREKLLADLGAPAESSEAKFVALAYQRWGLDLFRRLQGGFILAVWDQQNERLVVGRDPIGLNPCYYWRSDDQFIASSSIDAVLAQPEVGKNFNRAVIAEYIQRSLSSHQRSETFYEEIKRLPSAHWLSLTRHDLDIARYWDPIPPGFSWSNAEETSQFEELLEQAVGRCLSVGADSLALSGGFDSVSIAALAAEQIHGERPLHAISMRFRDPVCDEGQTQIAVAEALGMPQLIKTLEESLSGRSHVDVSETLSKTSPSPVLSVWQSFYSGLLNSAPQDCSRILMGTGGDDLLNVDLRYGADCLATFNLGALWRLLRVYQRTSPFSPAHIAMVVLWQGAIKYELRKLTSRAVGQISPRSKNWLRERFRSPPLVTEDILAVLEDRHRTAHRIELADGERSYVSAIRYLIQAPMLFYELEQAYAWSQQMGFTLLYPYFDKDFSAVSLRTHPEHLLTGGKAKAPLRRLVARRLPSVSLPSKKVDFTHMIHGVLRKDAASKWRDLGGPKMLEELGISSPQLINPVMENYFAGHSDNWLQVWHVLSTEMWLRARSGLFCASA